MRQYCMRISTDAGEGGLLSLPAMSGLLMVFGGNAQVNGRLRGLQGNITPFPTISSIMFIPY